VKVHQFELFADYFQFYLQDDETGAGDLSGAWTENATANMLASTERAIGIGTARNMDVSVEISVLNSPPTISNNEFDKLNSTTIFIKTGRLVVAGCTEYLPDAERINLTPGTYNALIGYKNLAEISEDGLDGNDSYHIWLYPA
jgi:hypothetical protein